MTVFLLLGIPYGNDEAHTAMRFDIKAGATDYHTLGFPATYRDVFGDSRIRSEIFVQLPLPPLVTYVLIATQLADDLVLFAYQRRFR